MRLLYRLARVPVPFTLPSMFTTPRLTASRLRRLDTADIHTALAESTAELTATCDWAYGSGSKKFSHQFVSTLLTQNNRSQRVDYVVRSTLDRVAVGMVALFQNHENPREWEIGFWRRSGCRGKGLMFEAASALIPLVQPQLGATRLLLTCHEKSTHVIRIAHRLGFEQVGIIQNDMDRHGQFRQILVFALKSNLVQSA